MKISNLNQHVKSECLFRFAQCDLPGCDYGDYFYKVLEHKILCGIQGDFTCNKCYETMPG